MKRKEKQVAKENKERHTFGIMIMVMVEKCLVLTGIGNNESMKRFTTEN